MDHNQLITKELIELRYKVMMQRINKLYLIYNMLLKNSENEITQLEIIKKQYSKMYNQVIGTEQYEKYVDVEDIIVKKIAIIELKIEQYVYNSIKNSKEIIENIINGIYESNNFQYFNGVDKEIENIETLKEIIKLFSPYINNEDIKSVEERLIKLKFDVLWRKQVELLIYENGGNYSALTQYDSLNEKESFKNFLNEKINSLKDKSEENQFLADIQLLENQVESVLKDSRLIEKLIIMDMKENSYNYINLLKAKIFNAHLCNIGNNPYDNETYITNTQLEEMGYRNLINNSDGLKASKVNYSLLKAVLKYITSENIDILECSKIYRKFGFECKPILLNIGQEIVKMIWDETKESKEYEKIMEKFEKDNKVEKDNEEQYLAIFFEGLTYEYDNDNRKDNLYEIISSKRNIQEKGEISIKNFLKSNEEKESIEEKIKEDVKKEGKMTNNVDVIIMLIEDLIKQYNIELCKEEDSDIKAEIGKLKNKISWLRKLKDKNGKLTYEETKKFLLTIEDVYNKLNIDYDERSVLPLECMKSEKEYFTAIPRRCEVNLVSVGHSYLGGFQYENRYTEMCNLTLLWKKYKEEFKNLKLDIKIDKQNYYAKIPEGYIYINSNDVSDLPINYSKMKILEKEELDNVTGKENESGRE